MKKISIGFAMALAVTGFQISNAASNGATNIKIDGSSTVYLLTEAVAEEFQKGKKDVRLTVGVSGTGGGIKKFTSNEIDIANASRKIHQKEAEKAKANKVEFTELEVGYDGIAIVVNPKNKFLESISVEDLKKIWEPSSKIKLWSDLNPKFPKEPVKLYGPGADSGTFDYFTQEINGKEKAIRTDFSSSENDNQLVQGVSGDPYAMGYFGYAYYLANKEKLKLLPVSNKGKPAVLPSEETIKNGTYEPLSRPLYIYVNNGSLKQPKVKEFVSFYLNNAGTLAGQVGYVSLDAGKYKEQQQKIESISASVPSK